MSEEEEKDESYLKFIDAFYDMELPSVQNLVAGLKEMGFNVI